MTRPIEDLAVRKANSVRAAPTSRIGHGDDPYRAITRLGERLSASLTTDEILPTVVATVADALRLPYVAIELGSGEITTIAAATGQPEGELLRMPLMDQGEQVGELIVAPRAPGEPFSRADRNRSRASPTRPDGRLDRSA